MPKWTKEQEEAIKKTGENIIVSAGAGSGKTAVLTARVIDKLKSGVHIEELLIMTFTSAASIEMKGRIRESLKKMPELSRELVNLDQAYITTFDSFSLSILKKYHYVLGFDKDINIGESSLLQMKKDEFMEEVFLKFYEKQDERFLSMIDELSVKDDEEIKSAILEIAKKLELKWNLKNFLDNYIDDYYKDEIIDKYIQEYLSLIEEAKEEIKELEEELYKEAGSEYASKVSELLKNVYENIDLELLKSTLSFRLPNIPKNSTDIVKSVKESLNNSIKKLKDLLEYGGIGKIKAIFYNTKNRVSVIIDILKEYFKLLDDYKRENKIYDFIDIAKMSINIVLNNPDIREEVKNSFKEILVDEYQDTNDLQEKFVSLISDNNVYMVGDIKQSIYRFRNANPNIFREKYNNYSKHIGGYKIDLLSNFRSRREVLEDINKIFRQVMDENIGGANYTLSHQMVFGNSAYDTVGKTNEDSKSEIWHYNKENKEYSNEEIEAFLVGRDIKNKINNGYMVYDKHDSIRKVNYSDFTILIDRATSFDLYRRVFNYLGIPLTLFKDESLEVSEDLSLILNIIDFVICIKRKEFDKSFKRDFVSIARSFLYEISDNDIYNYVKSNSISSSIIYNELKGIASILDVSDIYHVVSKIIEVTLFYEKCIRVGEEEACEIRVGKILELGISLSKLGYDIYDFRDYLKVMLKQGYSIKYQVNNTNENSVKIMTIHKSKGLDGTICYFTGLYKKFNIKEINEKIMYSDKYGIIVPYFDEGISETFLKVLVKNKYLLDEVSEKVRLFYVALTRAREKMIFVMPSVENREESERLVDYKIRKKYMSFSDILASLGGSILNQIKDVSYEDVVTKDYLFQTRKENISIEGGEKIEVSELPIIEKDEVMLKHFSKSVNGLINKQEIKNMNFGTKIHEVLEFIDFKNPRLDLIEDNFIKEKVSRFLRSEVLKNASEAEILKEYEFIYNVDGSEYHGIIDCMLVYKDYVDIIDYKLKHVEDEAYVKQLMGYKNYIEMITGKKVNTYLYSILDEEIKEIQIEKIQV